MALTYSSRYYEGLKEDSAGSAREAVPQILSLFPSRSVVDVGCGSGTWTAAYHDAGCEVLGIDGTYVKEEQLVFPREHFQRHDLRLRWPCPVVSTW
jgi:2-polyprenyl-3-methyl-5-hydroxy-6-metoxy-1,4-benzoquinol methylase